MSELCFSKYPQGAFPQLCITAVALPGNVPGLQGERFIDNERITGTIDEMVDEAVDFVNRNSRHSTIIDDKGKRADRDEYPLKAVREAILNALVHRDYSIHSENVPVRLEIYRNRLEIISSGGLYGVKLIDSLGKVRPDTRNSALAKYFGADAGYGKPLQRHSDYLSRAAEGAAATAGFLYPPWRICSYLQEQKFQVYDALCNCQQCAGGAGAIQWTAAYSIEERLIEFCTVPRSRQEII